MPEQSEEWHRAKGPSAEWKNGGGMRQFEPAAGERRMPHGPTGVQRHRWSAIRILAQPSSNPQQNGGGGNQFEPRCGVKRAMASERGSSPWARMPNGKNGGGGNRTRVREASELAFYTFSNPFMSYRRSFRLQNLAWPESLKSQSYIATM